MSCAPTVRPATVHDAEGIARLSDQVGYPSTDEEIARRLAQVIGHTTHAVYIAESDGRLIGWVHIFLNYSLLADMPAEIAGLVVDEN